VHAESKLKDTGRYSGFDAIGSVFMLSIYSMGFSCLMPVGLFQSSTSGDKLMKKSQIRCKAFVEALVSLLAEDGFYGASHGCVLKSHASHGVDLKSSAEDVTVE
jgi:hypothetical protein